MVFRGFLSSFSLQMFALTKASRKVAFEVLATLRASPEGDCRFNKAFSLFGYFALIGFTDFRLYPPVTKKISSIGRENVVNKKSRGNRLSIKIERRSQLKW